MTHLIGERYRPRLEKGLQKAGTDVIWLPDNPALDKRLAGHADLSVLIPRPDVAVIGKYLHPLLVNLLTNRGCRVIEAGEQGCAYPKDAGLCVCVTGKYTIYNRKTTDQAAVSFLEGTRIEVKQGYTKCSVCVVGNDAIITSDSAIAHRASNAGMNVLYIEPGYIMLDGFDTGFIGGASFLLNDQTIAFTGTLEKHPDRDRIIDFLHQHGVKPVFLTDDPLFDVGGAVCLP